MLAHILVNWLLSALLLLVIAQILPGFEISGFASALVAVLVVGLVGATLGVLLRMVAFPLTALTFGLFLLVIDAIVLKVASAVLPGFSIRGFSPALVAAFLLALLHLLLRVPVAANSAWL